MYVAYSQPYKHKVYNLLILVNEMHLFAISFIQIVFYTNNKSNKVILFTGWTMITLWIFNIITSFAIWIIFNIKERIRKCIPKASENIFTITIVGSQQVSEVNVEHNRSLNSSSVPNTAKGLGLSASNSSYSSNNLRNNETNHKEEEKILVITKNGFENIKANKHTFHS